MHRPRRSFPRNENLVEAATTNSTAPNGDSDRIPGSGAWSYEHTRILPEVFDSLDTDTTLNILDAGPAEPRSIDFFSRFRCRLYVANLFNPASRAHGLESAAAFFDTTHGVQFDVCFLWDYINYLDNDAFVEFVSILTDHVHENTRLYAIGAYSVELPLRAYRYAIVDVDKVAIRPTDGIVPQPRSRNDVVKVMRRWVVHRAALRRDNRLELLLRTIRTNWS